jgi:hypothetical protein
MTRVDARFSVGLPEGAAPAFVVDPAQCKNCNFARKSRVWRRKAVAVRKPGARRAIPDDNVEKVLLGPSIERQ